MLAYGLPSVSKKSTLILTFEHSSTASELMEQLFAATIMFLILLANNWFIIFPSHLTTILSPDFPRVENLVDITKSRFSNQTF